MTNLNTQLNRLMQALSGRERAILALRNWKEGKPHDPLLSRGMLPHEAREYNRLIGVMNACNCEVATIILALSHTLDSLELREAWLLTLRIWQVNQAMIDFALTSLIKEPITESEHHKLVESEGRKHARIDELATVVAIEERAWQDDDLQEVEWAGDLVVKEEAWERLKAEAEVRLRASVAAGELKARGKGKALQIEIASFNALVGGSWAVRPRWVDEFEIRPDEEAGRVKGDRAMLTHLQETVTNSALARMIDHKPNEPLTLTELMKALEERFCHRAKESWHEYRSLEIVLHEVAENEFNGEDVLRPKLQQLFADTRRRLEKLAIVAESYDAVFELDEPPEETTVQIRELIEKAAGK